MISTKSADFMRNHQVLARHKILQGEGWTNGPRRDVIDADNNGCESFVRGGFGDHVTGRVTYTSTEPALVTPYRDIQKFAANRGTEVVTQDDVGELKAKNSKHISMNFGDLSRLNYCKEKDVNVRTLSDVARELNPFPGKPARWAIDTANQEFVIYSPGSGHGPLAALEEPRPPV